MKFSTRATLVASEAIDPETFLQTYEAPPIARAALPGQFVHIRVSNLSAPLLRRPISILWSDRDSWIQILFKVVRTGTAILAEKREGEEVEIVGPLGTPFPFDATREAVMVAGGYGIAPVYFLGRANQERSVRRTLIYGARSESLLYLRDEMKEAFDEVIYTTEDGSLGLTGRVTGPLNELLAERPEASVYACGPNPMLAAVQRAALEHDVPCWLSLENRMGCGIGACLGCVVRTHEGFKTTCKEGPVFDAREVVFE